MTALRGRTAPLYGPVPALVGGVALAALVVVPLVALVVGADAGALQSRALFVALGLSLWTSTLALGLVILSGTPLAAWLAGARGWVRRAVEVLVLVPLVMPPAVAGLALLLAYGRQGWLGRDGVAFSPLAVVLAQAFVAFPFYVRTAAAAFASVDSDLVAVARSLGATPRHAFRAVVAPLALPGLLAGAALAWARALGEFGATLMFAGNLPGRTQTLPVAIYVALERDLDEARAMAVVLLGFSALLLLVVHRRDGSWRP